MRERPATRVFPIHPSLWGVLAKCHDVRNLGEYEGDLNIDERLLTDLIVACKAVAAALDKLPPPA